MVSAADALKLAIRDGVLERKRRTGWTKKHFVLTPTTLMYFDSLTSSEPGNSFATMEIISVVKSETDIQHRVFTIVLFKKKKEYRAKSAEERDAWVEALESVAGMKGTGEVVIVKRKDSQSTDEERPATEADSKGDADPAMPALGPREVKDVDLRVLCDQMKKSFSWQVQINKSFSPKDVADFIRKTLPQLSLQQVQEVGQGLIDQKLIIPLKSHVFDEKDPGRFKFVEAAAPKQPKNHLNIMRGPSIATLMGNEQFNARKYAEDFLRKHTPQKIDAHCNKLVAQKENTIEDLKEEISASYTSFIRAANEIKAMENSVSQLKTLVLECRRTMYALKGVALEAPLEQAVQPHFKAVDKKAEERKQNMALDEFIRDLEVYLNERNYGEFTNRMLEYKQKQTQGVESATEEQQAKIDELRLLLVEKLVDEFNASLQTSERMHKKENHLEFLIQLGETQLATEMCLQNYSVRIALQLRHVPSYGNALSYVINFSRTFFTSLLVCYEDYEHSFEELQYLESPKLSSSLRPKHIVGILTNAAYIQDDCSARSTNILQEYLPKAALQNREVEAQNAAIWDKLVSIGVKRCGQSLMKMSFNWQDVDLADDALPDTSSPAETNIKPLFADVVVKELADMTNQQLNKSVQSYNPVRVAEVAPGGKEKDEATDASARGPFPSMVLGSLLQEMLNDEAWWQGFGGKGGVARKRLGYGGVNKFLAEINLLRDIVPANKFVDVKLRELDEKIVSTYQQLHPGKKDVRAPADWVQTYAKKCITR
ncbi:endocytosis defective- protein [Phytophthora boehmeriae]|uniref:Endocytosis defective- protein n=1 Tax=Phytophthora boehmeriae TaxID=109152 RepID=A0A8T1X5S3_9STRA|nr:endocytosis defective- protein [Phytophthora boehmeriae]